MSTFTTSLAMLGLAALGVVGWQASRPVPDVPSPVALPADPVFASALPGLPALPARMSAEPPRDHLTLPPDLGPNGMPCGLQVRAEPVAPAMVALTIEDACRPDTPVVVDHGGLRVTLRTDPQGHAALLLPALSDPARVELRIADGGMTRHCPGSRPGPVSTAWRCPGPAARALRSMRMNWAPRIAQSGPCPSRSHRPSARCRPGSRWPSVGLGCSRKFTPIRATGPGRRGSCACRLQAACGQTVAGAAVRDGGLPAPRSRSRCPIAPLRRRKRGCKISIRT